MKIVIQTQADFTPPGTRTARVVATDRGGRQLRWYVSGRTFRKLPVNAANINLTQEWIAASTRINPSRYEIRLAGIILEAEREGAPLAPTVTNAARAVLAKA